MIQIAVDQFLRGDVAPGLDDVALVLRLVVDDRLAVGLAPFEGALDVPVLHADMADPRLAVVVVHVLVAVVDRLQVTVGVVLLEDVEVAVPLAERLGVEQEVVFVGERPPDVAVGGEPRREIGDIAEVLLRRHVAVAPAVVGVEDDDVGLDAEVAQRGDLLLEMPEGHRDLADRSPPCRRLPARKIGCSGSLTL